MFRWLKRKFRNYAIRQLNNEKCVPTPVEPSSSFGPNGYCMREEKKHQHQLSSLMDTLSPVAQDLMKGYLETRKYRTRLDRETQANIARETELTKVLVEIYHINLEEFKTLLDFEENL